MSSSLSPRGTSEAGSAGLSLVELLVVVSIVSILLLAINGLLDSSLKGATYASDKNDLSQQARFAMGRMTRALNHSNQLVLPLVDNPGTTQLENIRDPGVFAVALDAAMDRDSDGFADADNDKDGLVDEDFGGDATNDSAPGIVGIDDNNDGSVDVSTATPSINDDDEDNNGDEDYLDGIDNDGDGSINEDLAQDMNNDAAAGIAGVDDDGDGSVDEGGVNDDDEDGATNEDWLDVIVYFLNGGQLVERMPNLNPANGTDYTENIIADNVSAFRVERIVQGNDRYLRVDLILELTNAESGESITLQTQVRVGSAL